MPILRRRRGIAVSLRHTGDLAAIEALGFEAHQVLPGQAMGVIRFRDIARIEALPAVERIVSGIAPAPSLDTAVPDVKARAQDPAMLGITGLWNAVIATGALTNRPDATGKDVIVAVIDTGIDYTHPAFKKQLAPTEKTRILRIWDQGLAPSAASDCPRPEPDDLDRTLWRGVRRRRDRGRAQRRRGACPSRLHRPRHACRGDRRRRRDLPERRRCAPRRRRPGGGHHRRQGARCAAPDRLLHRPRPIRRWPPTGASRTP